MDVRRLRLRVLWIHLLVTHRNLREDESCGDEDEMTTEEKHARARWLIAGSTDTKVSIWASMKFEKSQKTNA